jgi:indolepyruvate ferredoxin oxidoreductase
MASFDAEQVAVQLIGDSIYTNPLILGFAWQKGRVPLSHAALMRAIELNAVQVDNNKAAFEWGRRCAHDLASVQAMFKAAQVIEFVKKPSQTEMLTKRVAFLTAYQNAAYAQAYQAFVEKVRAIEAPLGKTTLTEAVTRYLFKLMAYKDEYEVARLHTDTGFLNKVNAMFEGDFKLNYHLAPPLLAKKNDKGELQKQQFGSWMLTGFKLLAKLKGVRGTPFDVFGRSEERKEERALIAEYRASVEEVLASLSLENHATAVEIARIPELIKGYGHVKARHLAVARPQWKALMQTFRQPERVREAAAA